MNIYIIVKGKKQALIDIVTSWKKADKYLNKGYEVLTYKVRK